MISTSNPTFALIIIALLINITDSVVINFDSNAKTLDIKDSIIRKSRISCEDPDETLNLSDNNLRKIPAGFIKSRTLRSISLNNNEIQEIPYGVFDYVPNLECLDLTNNKIPPSELLNFRHHALKTLIFDHQRNIDNKTLDILTNDLLYNMSQENFPNVETLSLKGSCPENFINYLNLFPKLSTIYLDNNYVEHLHPDLVAYIGPRLKSIHLEQNELKNVTISNTHSVEALYLDNNPLERLVIETHPNLKILSVANCNVKEQWYMSLSNIVTLDLSGNQCDELIIGEMFSEADNLENLFLSRNQFERIPYLAKFPQLKKLSLSYNLIETIDGYNMHANSLKTLDLKGNRINKIDSYAFSDTPMLEELDLSHNQLVVLPDFWGEQLNMLRYLNLKSNSFQSVFDMSISQLNIDTVHVGNNCFRAINETSMKYLPNNCTVYVV